MKWQKLDTSIQRVNYKHEKVGEDYDNFIYYGRKHAIDIINSSPDVIQFPNDVGIWRMLCPDETDTNRLVYNTLGNPICFLANPNGDPIFKPYEYTHLDVKTMFNLDYMGPLLNLTPNTPPYKFFRETTKNLDDMYND
jgi:hypothetical protein